MIVESPRIHKWFVKRVKITDSRLESPSDNRLGDVMAALRVNLSAPLFVQFVFCYGTGPRLLATGLLCICRYAGHDSLRMLTLP
jgi:hypothetical protein